MDAERTEAIVLRHQSVTESSLIVTWFTREFGRVRTLAKGARRPKSPFRGKLDLFYHDEIVFLRSRRSDLHILHDCFLANPHAKFRDTVEALTAASYVGELVELVTAMEDPNPKMFDLLSAALDALETARGRASVLIWFELQLLTAAGWAPKWNVHGAANRMLDSLAVASVEGARRVRLNEKQVLEVRTTLWSFWDEHIGRTPRSRKLLTETLPR